MFSRRLESECCLGWNNHGRGLILPGNFYGIFYSVPFLTPYLSGRQEDELELLLCGLLIWFVFLNRIDSRKFQTLDSKYRITLLKGIHETFSKLTFPTSIVFYIKRYGKSAAQRQKTKEYLCCHFWVQQLLKLKLCAGGAYGV